MVAQDRPVEAARRSRGETAIEVLELEQRIAAQPSTVFAYLTDPARFVEWMGVSAELDPKPGGAYRIDADGEHVASGRYLEVQPPHRLVMTWGWEGNEEIGPGSTTVEITLMPDGAGTLLRLRHASLPTEEALAQHAAGWNLYLGRLVRVLR